MKSDKNDDFETRTFNWEVDDRRECLYQILKHVVDTTELKNCVEINELTAFDNVNALLDAITPHIPTKTEIFENVLKNSALNATGLAGMKDDRAWSVNDQGGILISADKGQSFKLTKEGKLQNNYTNVVEKLRDLIRRIQ